MNALDLLKERGFVKQITFEEDLYKAFENEVVPFYVGFDPTADSLHIGHYIPIMAMAHLQKAGHKPFALMGGGTGMIGDPSGKSDLRKVLTVEDIDNNVSKIKAQMERFLDFDESKENCAVIEQCRLAAHPELHRLPARRRRAVQRKPHAHRRMLQAASRARPDLP